MLTLLAGGPGRRRDPGGPGRGRRGGGRGRGLTERAVERARDRGCALVQLTSDKRRADAHRFYTGLGFTPSREGFEPALPRRPVDG
ncbi:GNAT family N-acetyltransferase [Streptomyces koyangensis]